MWVVLLTTVFASSSGQSFPTVEQIGSPYKSPCLCQEAVVELDAKALEANQAYASSQVLKKYDCVEVPKP